MSNKGLIHMDIYSLNLSRIGKYIIRFLSAYVQQLLIPFDKIYYCYHLQSAHTPTLDEISYSLFTATCTTVQALCCHWLFAVAGGRWRQRRLRRQRKQSKFVCLFAKPHGASRCSSHASSWCNSLAQCGSTLHILHRKQRSNYSKLGGMGGR